jgi:hypothetical protein
MKESAKKIWGYIDGHKTVICLGAAEIMQQAIKHNVLKDSGGLQFSINILIILGGGALGHHVTKIIKKRR